MVVLLGFRLSVPDWVLLMMISILVLVCHICIVMLLLWAYSGLMPVCFADVFLCCLWVCLCLMVCCFACFVSFGRVLWVCLDFVWIWLVLVVAVCVVCFGGRRLITGFVSVALGLGFLGWIALLLALCFGFEGVFMFSC